MSAATNQPDPRAILASLDVDALRREAQELHERLTAIRILIRAATDRKQARRRKGAGHA